jgi:hypothetical protein
MGLVEHLELNCRHDAGPLTLAFVFFEPPIFPTIDGDGGARPPALARGFQALAGGVSARRLGSQRVAFTYDSRAFTKHRLFRIPFLSIAPSAD